MRVRKLVFPTDGLRGFRHDGGPPFIGGRENSDIKIQVTRSIQNREPSSVSWPENEITPADSADSVHIHTERVVEERLHTKTTELKDIASRLTHESEVMFLYIYRIEARLESSMNARKAPS